MNCENFTVMRNTQEVMKQLFDIQGRLVKGEEVKPKELSWLDDVFPFECAKALYLEVPYIEKIAKMILCMDDTLKINITVK